MARFQKGQSGNPGGRPKGVGDLRELARQHTGDALKVLLQVMADESAAPSARFGAATAVLDRGWGRAHVTVDANVNNGPTDTSDLLTGASELLKLFKQQSESKRETETAPGAQSKASPALS